MPTQPSLKEGIYRKSDELSITINKKNNNFYFIFNNTVHCIIFESNGFNIEWEFGKSYFSISNEGYYLTENNTNIFWRDLLSDNELFTFRDIGTCISHNSIPYSLYNKALLCNDVQNIINKAKMKKQLWYSETSYDENITKLLDPIWGTIKYIMQDNNIRKPGGAQIAVQLPGGKRLAPGEIGCNWHIDGLHTPNNGINPSEIKNFAFLIGITLTDIPYSNMGNFSYIPGSHKAIGRAISNYSSIDDAVSCLKIKEGQSVQQGFYKLGIKPEILSPPECVCCNAGSVYLAHYQTIHFVQSNVIGTNPRVVVYFRISNNNIDKQYPNYRILTHENMFKTMPTIDNLPK